MMENIENFPWYIIFFHHANREKQKPFHSHVSHDLHEWSVSERSIVNTDFNMYLVLAERFACTGSTKSEARTQQREFNYTENNIPLFG